LNAIGTHSSKIDNNSRPQINNNDGTIDSANGAAPLKRSSAVQKNNDGDKLQKENSVRNSDRNSPIEKVAQLDDDAPLQPEETAKELKNLQKLRIDEIKSFRVN